MAKDLNKATLIGNLTRDPELRYIPQGAAVCSFSVATNRQWKADGEETKQDVEFHRIVAWNQLAEICSKILKKGSRVYVEGRLKTRQWEDKEGGKRSTTEIVISDMIALDSRRDGGAAPDPGDDFNPPDDFGDDSGGADDNKTSSKAKGKKESKKADKVEEDIPF